MLSDLYAAIATVAAAAIAGAISFISTVLSKEQKTSEFRQTWIDGVRDDISEFVSRIEVITAFLAAKHSHDPSADKFEMLFSQSGDIREASARYYRLQLRLNPSEHKSLLHSLSDLYNALSNMDLICDRDKISTMIQNIISPAQLDLKTEWKRVKRGEPVFFITKSVSLGFFLFAVVFFIYLIYV